MRMFLFYAIIQDMEKLERLNQYISKSGRCSRREADTAISEGRVKINGELAQLGMRVQAGDVVTLDGIVIEHSKEHIILMYNKPAGITCTTEQHIPGNIIDAINYPERIFPIGRLDKDSEGLILLTNDGDLVNKILRHENAHEKEYLVKVNKSITPQFLRQMAKGVRIHNPVTDEMTTTLPCTLYQVDDQHFKIILNQGLNRQIRRMCSALDYRVIFLKRLRIMHLTVYNIKKGQTYRLTPEETQILLNKL